MRASVSSCPPHDRAGGPRQTLPPGRPTRCGSVPRTLPVDPDRQPSPEEDQPVMATQEECRRRWSGSPPGSGTVDEDERKQHAFDRSLSCRVPDLDVTFSGRPRGRPHPGHHHRPGAEGPDPADRRQRRPGGADRRPPRLRPGLAVRPGQGRGGRPRPAQAALHALAGLTGPTAAHQPAPAARCIVRCTGCAGPPRRRDSGPQPVDRGSTGRRRSRHRRRSGATLHASSHRRPSRPPVRPSTPGAAASSPDSRSAARRRSAAAPARRAAGRPAARHR